ncbi:MAG: two pore domain potassium channel family protein, partial [Desulfobacterales bacterium]|nr:two pore domain potassium channel family protein [Desulfobacterales bacterium]
LVSLYNDKAGYTKRSWLNLLILLLSPPLIAPQGFASIRSLRALRSLRILIAVKRGIKPILDVFEKNSLHYVTIITVFLIIASSIAFSWLEQRDLSYGLWWAITTVTTVGYGDTYPETNMGRTFAVLVMIIGIGFVSLLTANIASYFVEKDLENEKTNKIDTNQLLLERLEEFSKKIDEINRKLP